MGGAGVPSSGSIPACTGEAALPAVQWLVDEVYPRMHGGSSLIIAMMPIKAGLSPHARGKRGAEGGG